MVLCPPLMIFEPHIKTASLACTDWNSIMNKQEAEHKSRLGLLLIEKGLITSEQLDRALRIQNQTGNRLGEILVTQGWISQRQLNRSLQKQSRYRAVAAVTAMLLGPLQPFMAQAATDEIPTSVSAEIGDSAKQHKSLQALDDMSLSSVSAQGAQTHYNKLMDIVSNAANGEQAKGNNIEQITTMAKLLFPGLDMIDADMEVVGVEYEDTNHININRDGSVGIQMPKRIKGIAFKNVRVQGAEGQHMGDLFINNINFEGTEVKVRIRS